MLSRILDRLLFHPSCFDRFFKSVNAQSHKFQQKRHSIRLIHDEDLVGLEYLWKLITNGSDDVTSRGIQLMKEIYTNISSQLKQDIKRYSSNISPRLFSTFETSIQGDEIEIQCNKTCLYFRRYRTTYGTLELYRNNELIHSLWERTVYSADLHSLHSSTEAPDTHRIVRLEP